MPTRRGLSRCGKPVSMSQIVSMVKNHVLRPVVDAAARLGEEVLSSRAAQKAFELRPVHKYAFTVAPLRSGEASPTQHSSGGDGGGHSGGSGRGIAVFPGLGQVVSVSGKSTLVAHREKLSLQYLRRSFLRIGRRAAWGEVRKEDALFSSRVPVRSRSSSVVLAVWTVHRSLLLDSVIISL